MMYILNDYSIDNQFKDIDAFLDSLNDNTIPLLKLMDNYKLDLLKSHEIYNLKIINSTSLFELLNLRGYPEISKVKSLLHKRFYDNPYWEKEKLSHDCIDEAFKQDTGLISFEHKDYLEDKVKYLYEETSYIISNSYNKQQLLEELRKKEVIKVGDYLERKFDSIQSFCNINDKDYFEDFLKDNDIKKTEIDKIVDDLNDFMYKYLNNKDLGRLSKKLEVNLYEFRTTIADAKEFRILYCLNQSKLIFLNCFIKKQQKTPENEKVLGRKLRDNITP